MMLKSWNQQELTRRETPQAMIIIVRRKLPVTLALFIMVEPNSTWKITLSNYQILIKAM
jgi:hypothetical protein